jgi:alkanesulfonate monooxygenase SsuD/methylene tetrahydromethanopterin reductase-like flavin-dependent oxidoreductase (luciferase family)
MAGAVADPYTQVECALSRIGVHLPLYDPLGGSVRETLGKIRKTPRVTKGLGFGLLAASDHLKYNGPWIDGLMAMASAVVEAEGLTLMTAAALPVVRGGAALSKALVTLACLGGSVIAGVGAGSFEGDFSAVFKEFHGRWSAFDTEVRRLRDLLGSDAAVLGVEPPPLWIASWGSRRGMGRAVELGDGWLASGYNLSHKGLEERLVFLREASEAQGRTILPWGVSTVFLHVDGETGRCGEEILFELGRALKRDPNDLRSTTLVGDPEHCADNLRTYANLNARYVLVWPLGDPDSQLNRLVEDVIPLVGDAFH